MEGTNNKLSLQDLGANIAQYRERKGLTQASVAERLDLGVDAISRMERGAVNITLDRLIDLAELFDCELAELVETASARLSDQTRYVNQLIELLDDDSRQEFLQILKALVKWKLR